MGKASDLSAIEKSKIITMRESGSSYRVISKSVGRSVTAVKNVLDCFQKEKVLVSGRKTRCENELKISKKTARYLYLLSKRSRRKTLPVLTEELNLAVDSPVSLSTVRRSLVNYGMNGREACKKPLLRKVNIKKRLKFAKEHVNWTTKQWEKVLFTDETKVEIFGTHRRTFVRRAPGERYNNECLVPTVKFGGGSVLCWGAISSKGVLPLHRIDGIMKKETYHQILIRKVYFSI